MEEGKTQSDSPTAVRSHKNELRKCPSVGCEIVEMHCHRPDDGFWTATRDQLYKIGLPGKSILGDYFQQNRTSRRPFLLLGISFPGRPIFIQLPPGGSIWWLPSSTWLPSCAELLKVQPPYQFLVSWPMRAEDLITLVGQGILKWQRMRKNG